MKNLVSLDGKRVVVTGAGQGIGRAVAELCVELGARVAAVDLNADAVNEFAENRKDKALSCISRYPCQAQSSVTPLFARSLIVAQTKVH